MIVEQYGLSYHRVTENDLETIRYWRNQEFIRSMMQFDQYITPEMQIEWFKKINNSLNYYFVIVSNNQKIGLINSKNTEIDTRIAEGGIFIWEETFWGTPVPVLASLTMLEAVFDVFQSGDASVINVRKENKKALIFNKLLGYQIYGESLDKKCWRMKLEKYQFEKIKDKLRSSAKIFSGGKEEFIIHGKPDSIQDQAINDYLLKLKSNNQGSF